MQRDVMNYDVLIVGGGPAGRLLQSDSSSLQKKPGGTLACVYLKRLLK